MGNIIEGNGSTWVEETLNCDLAVLILAGGQSSRMGQDKALMSWDGKPMLAVVCEVARHVSTSIQVLSPWPSRYADIVPKTIDRCLERTQGRGPLWALNDGLLHDQTHYPTSWILLLACDMPYLNIKRLQQWRSQLSSLPSNCLAYVPLIDCDEEHSFRWEPLCGFYRRSCQSSLQLFLDQGGQSFQQWLHQVGAIAISVEPQDRKMFYNCNSPEDFISHSTSSPSLS